MKKYPFLFLLGMGTFGAGMGGIYSSFANQEPYIERLFQKIKEQILDFSDKHPLDNTAFKNEWKVNKTDCKSKSKEDQQTEVFAPPKSTLEAFIYLWLGLIILNNEILKKDTKHLDDLKKLMNDDLKDKLEKLSKEKFKSIYEDMEEFSKLIEVKEEGGYVFIPYFAKIDTIDKLNKKQDS